MDNPTYTVLWWIYNEFEEGKSRPLFFQEFKKCTPLSNKSVSMVCNVDFLTDNSHIVHNH